MRGAFDRSTTATVKRLRRRFPRRVRLLGAGAAIGLGLLVITGCHGSPVQSTATFTVNCTGQALPSYTTTVSIDLPAWTDPNEDIPVSNVAIYPQLGATMTGTGWSAAFSVQGGTSPVSFTDFNTFDGSGDIVDQTVKTVHVTAPAGGQVVVSLDTFTGSTFAPRVGVIPYTCTPAPGVDPTVGIIPVHGGSS